MNKRFSAGFTLLEVLVALAIFATAAVSVMRAVSQHINTMNYLEEKMFASIVADNQMAKVMLAPKQLAAKEGKESMAGQDWFWKIKPVNTSSGTLKAFDVMVSKDKKASPLITVRSYVGS
ncbi:type II secretion system minor pseudopilin GspI [Vibrio tritonius]|uniref:type II secretion system minor pseudopilin GspI n=1 Tax=Vibrio tritonius TaxID=1435069 RepID=UPI000837ED8F|nr:type II secretion system minor pseudopilin GspI [Vibrio tritonius]